MGRNRLYMSQDALDRWVDEERVNMDGDRLSLRDEDLVCLLAPAVLFLREATGADDPHDLLGRVKDEEQLAALGADAYMDSVLLGDNAYDVQRGFVAVPQERPSRNLKDTIEDAAGELAMPDAEASDELADFLLDHLK